MTHIELQERVPTVDRAAVADAVTALLLAIGENPEREGLRETPTRVANAWAEFMDYDPGTLDTTFEQGTYDDLTVVSGMRVWSYCEHHLLPFWCDVAIGYIPAGRILGLSKFARIAHDAAHMLATQESLVSRIADDVREIADTPDVAVVARGEHLCMVSRGIRTHGLMTSASMSGAFRDDPAARAEFLTYAGIRA